MPLDKAIASGKEHRKLYRGSKRHNRSCRNHGGCSWCEGNRTLQTQRARDAANEQLKEGFAYAQK